MLDLMRDDLGEYNLVLTSIGCRYTRSIYHVLRRHKKNTADASQYILSELTDNCFQEGFPLSYKSRNPMLLHLRSVYSEPKGSARNTTFLTLHPRRGDKWELFQMTDDW